MNQGQRAKDRCIDNNQTEHRNDEVARPPFSPGKSICDERRQNSNDRHQWRGNMQPFASRDALAAHDVWADVANREQDRQVRADRCQSCKPGQDPDRKRLL